jgi:hypothetical protein
LVSLQAGLKTTFSDLFNRNFEILVYLEINPKAKIQSFKNSSLNSKSKENLNFLALD